MLRICCILFCHRSVSTLRSLTGVGRIFNFRFVFAEKEDLAADMGKLISLGKVLDCLCLSSSLGSGCTCFCMNVLEDEFERKPLMTSDEGQLMRLKDHLKPKMVVLRVSMHCHGCARKVEKHISKLEGVTSYKVDLESKMVMVNGDIIPFEVLESVSKVKNAELWNPPS